MDIAKISYSIGRSHMYWGRKPIVGLLDIFEDIKKGDIVLDPFCGGGNPAIAALMKGGKVIAGDLNPMAVFLTKVLVRPINLAMVKSAFEDVSDMVSRNILRNYQIQCPQCKQLAILKAVVWVDLNTGSKPEAAQIECRQCGEHFSKLSSAEVTRQLNLSKMRPRFWFPKTPIHSLRRPPVEHHYELFTGRNLSMLAELLHAIKQVPSNSIQDALLYAFTAMLYNCSSMQMFSEKEPSSSRGWTALRFYIPPRRKEVNVWYAFTRRFDKLMSCKSDLNYYMPAARITDSVGDFSLKDYDALIYKTDAFELIRQLGHRANFIFLDPPYIDDVDYFGFSEFWGTWLKMHFEFDHELHPKRAKVETLKRLLMLTSEVAPKSCKIGLAFAPKHKKGWNEADCIKESKYHIKRLGYFYYDNSNKRGLVNNQSDRFTILERDISRRPTVASGMEEARQGDVDSNVQELMPYLRVIAHLYPRDHKSQLEPVRERSYYEKNRSLASQLVPDRLTPWLRYLRESDIETAISNKEENKKSYHSICYSLLRIILSKDEWQITYTDPSQFEVGVLGMAKKVVTFVKPSDVPQGVVFVAQNGDRKLLFCFDDQDALLLRRISNEIKDRDNGEFNTMCMLIAPSIESMNMHRKVSKSGEWPRGFLLCFPEVCKRCELVNENEYLNLCARYTASISYFKERSRIMSMTAEVNDNIPVGEENPNHYKLKFQTIHSFNIMPGQFIMMSTTKQNNEKGRITPQITGDKLTSSFNLEPTSYLKRPFGIHRAFYPHFGAAYLKNLALPHTLATVLHTVFPNEFEVFYKVLTNGVGTKELSRMKRGDKIQIIGPLGKGLNMREIRDHGFKEIHVIGGGVGMAPLIFMVQALRYFSYNVKAFVGTEKIGMLKYKQDSDGLGETFSVEPRDATLYIDDLIDTGVDPADIYVSSTTSEGIHRKIRKGNLYEGFVTEQYNNYLEHTKSQKKVLAFACGPIGMMKALSQITAQYGIQLKVLMEKRMACGIGVCLSCVCETKSGEGNYSRVCTDGPIFDAGEILWERIH